MATISQVRGLLLEEALLHLLARSGYRTVESDSVDPTLAFGPAGLEVRGRGERHQIDAIADFLFPQPFSNPQRLLVEAKCYADSRPVGLPVLRNALGVLMDVSEFFVPATGPKSVSRRRYHYQYALFSASNYTEPAERYAFAHDIYLIPLQGSAFIRPIVSQIRRVTHHAFGAPTRNQIDLDLSAFRRSFRRAIRSSDYNNDARRFVRDDSRSLLSDLLDSCRTLDGAVLGMLSGTFPIFLVPTHGVQVSQLHGSQDVHITWDNEGWYLSDQMDGQLFSFDLPPTLFEMYAEEGVLTRAAALEMKADYMREIQAIIVPEEYPRFVTFRLDLGWLERLRGALRDRPRRRPEGV